VVSTDREGIRMSCSSLFQLRKWRCVVCVWCRRYGPDLTWYVPLGLKPWFSSLGIRNVIELDWWQEVQHGGTKVGVCVCVSGICSRASIEAHMAWKNDAEGVPPFLCKASRAGMR
jgi:hypothetical protein